MKVRKILPLCIVCSLMLCGCWDKVEIDKRAFVSTIGVDVNSKVAGSNVLDIGDKELKEELAKKLVVTYGYPDMSELGPGEKSSSDEKTLKVKCSSMEDAFSKASIKSSRTLNVGHSKLLILSNKLLEYPQEFKEVIDYMQREPRINRMMYVVTCEGLAEEFVKYKPGMENNIETYILGLMDNSDRNAAIVPTKLNDLLKSLVENRNALIPNIKIDKDTEELALDGVSVIKNYGLVGNFNNTETAAIELLKGKAKSGKKIIYKDNHPIDYVIENESRKLKIELDNMGQLHINMDIDLEGQIKGYVVENEVFSPKGIENLERTIDEELKKEFIEVIGKSQKIYETDVFGITDYVRRIKPKMWKDIKENFGELYKNAKIEVNVSSKIRRIGATK